MNMLLGDENARMVANDVGNGAQIDIQVIREIAATRSGLAVERRRWLSKEEKAWMKLVISHFGRQEGRTRRI